MKEFFSGEKLFGDDFAFDELAQWYQQEAEGYAEIGNKNLSEYKYIYHHLNRLLGYRFIKTKPCFNNVLGFGSAFGFEFLPIIDKIKDLHIIEPSDKLVSLKLEQIVPKYSKPHIEGNLSFEDNSFDLITCFGTLHHIPNVTLVLNELIRVLKYNGFLLLREPITTMGDWRVPRNGLTKNERGIPVNFFDSIFNRDDIKVVKKSFCQSVFFYKLISYLFLLW